MKVYLANAREINIKLRLLKIKSKSPSTNCIINTPSTAPGTAPHNEIPIISSSTNSSFLWVNPLPQLTTPVSNKDTARSFPSIGHPET